MRGGETVLLFLDVTKFETQLIFVGLLLDEHFL